MARSKNSPALFEVIRNAQQKQKEQLERQRQHELTATEVSPAAALLRSPLYWFKGKHAHEAAHGGPQAAPTTPVMREVRSPKAVEPERVHVQVRPSFVETDPDESVPEAIEAAPVVVQPAIAESTVVASEPEAPVVTSPAQGFSNFAAEQARLMREEMAAQEAPASEPFFDSREPAAAYEPTDPAAPSSVDNYLTGQGPTGQIALRFSHTTAAIAGVGILAALCIVYIIGSHSRSNAIRLANNVRSDVLNVAPDQSGTTTPVPTNLIQQDPTHDPATEGVRADGGSTARTLGLETFGKPIPVPTSVKRVIGLQYVVLLSFPRADDAKELVQFLADNGIPATAEKALPGYSPSWYSVVTTRGFDHVRKNPDYDSYVSALGKLMQKYARGSKFKTFQPDVYTWRGN